MKSSLAVLLATILLATGCGTMTHSDGTLPTTQARQPSMPSTKDNWPLDLCQSTDSVYCVEDTNTHSMTGVFLGPHGLKYFGTAVDGIFEGTGTMISDRFIYQGEWSNARWNGKGMIQWRDGTIYVGTFQNGQATGNGHMWFTNGDYYVGDIENGCLNGTGLYFWKELSFVSHGDFVNGALVKTNYANYVTNMCPTTGWSLPVSPPAAETPETHP
ncbi:MAG: hypothetical protein AB7U43_10845 [Desulfobacter sp.]